MNVHFGGTEFGYKKIKTNYNTIRRSVKSLKHNIARDWLNPKVAKSTSSYMAAFEATLKAIYESDAVVLESTFGSSAVGQQLRIALEKEIPVLLLRTITKEEEINIDAFVREKESWLLHQEYYTNNNVKEKLRKFFEWVEKNSGVSRFNLELEKPLDNYLREKAKANKTSKSEEIRRLILADMDCPISK